jgi:hypothetical protein
MAAKAVILNCINLTFEFRANLTLNMALFLNELQLFELTPF